MKVCRFDEGRIGEVVGDDVVDIGHLVPDAGTLGGVDPLIAALPRLRAMDVDERRDGVVRALTDVVLRSPIVAPGKIVAAPVNYMAHVAEASADPAVVYGHTLTDIGEAGLFLKASSSLSAHLIRCGCGSRTGAPTTRSSLSR